VHSFMIRFERNKLKRQTRIKWSAMTLQKLKNRERSRNKSKMITKRKKRLKN